MSRLLALCLMVGLVGAAEAKDLQFRIVDSESGKPIGNVKVARFASMWQPRILLPPGKFWFPHGELRTDAAGIVSFERHASDDVYYFEAEGYERGRVERHWFQYTISRGSGGERSNLVENAGQFIVPLKGTSPK